MRRLSKLSVAFVVMAATLASALPAAADPPATVVYQGIRMGCGFDLGWAWADSFIDVSTDSQWADLTIWDGGEEPVIVAEGPLTLTSDDSSAVAEVALVYLATGEPAGTALISAVHEAAGPTEVFDDRWREGNRWVEAHDEYTPLLVAETLELSIVGEVPQIVEAIDCWGDRYLSEYWSTNPTSYVNRYSGTDVSCEFQSDSWYVWMTAWADGDRSSVDLAAWAPGSEPWYDEPAYYGYSQIEGLDPGALSVAIDLWAPWSDEPIGIAIVDGTVTYGDVVKSKTFSQNSQIKRTAQALNLVGTLSLPDDITFDLTACSGATWSERTISTQPNGPKIDAGPVPANDSMAGATNLKTKANGQNRNATFEPEVACSVYDEFGDAYFDLPIAKTLWYTVEGTGKPMTVDSSGTDFDTVLGVYTKGVDGITQIGCVDDVFATTFSLQASLTFDTVKGQTYYLQIGGYGGQYGHVKLSTK